MKSIAALAGLGLGLLAWALVTHQPASIEVSNQTGLAITDVRIRVGDDLVARSAMGRGAVDRHSVSTRREGPVVIEMRFADGSTRAVAAGWFSPAGSEPTQVHLAAVDSMEAGR